MFELVLYYGFSIWSLEVGWEYTFKVIYDFDLLKYCLMIFTVGTASEFRIFFFFGNISIGYILYIHILNFFFFWFYLCFYLMLI